MHDSKGNNKIAEHDNKTILNIAEINLQAVKRFFQPILKTLFPNEKSSVSLFASKQYKRMLQCD